MMRVELNGKLVEIQDANLSVLLQEHTGQSVFAVAINGEFVPRASYSKVRLKEGDTIDIVSPMQGG